MDWLTRQALALSKASSSNHFDLAALFGNWLVIGGLSVLLLLWAAYSSARLRIGVQRLCRALDRCTAHLAATPATAREFAASYESISTSLQNAPILGPAWRDWSATLITPTGLGSPVRSTNRPDNYFSLGLLRACGINPRLHAAMPNLLVGVGLLLTFVGLSIALSAAGNIVGAPSATSTKTVATPGSTIDSSSSMPGGATPNVIAAPATMTERQDALKGLLDAASAKFVTSLVGLLCSLAYTSFRSHQLVRAERSLDRFLAALEERIPLATPASLQAEANALLEKSLTVQTQFATEVAVNIGGRLDSALDQRLGEHIGPLREAIEKLSEGIGTKSEDTLRILLEQFREMLQGSAQQHMEKLASALSDTSSAMEQIRGGLADAASKMAGAADQIAEQMGEKADEAMGRITLQMEGLVGELRTLSEQSRAAGDDAMAQAALRISEAGDSFGAAARAISSSLEKTVAGITTRLGGEAEAATRRMTEELTRAIGAMRDLAEQNRTAGNEATQVMAERIAQAAAGFERSAAQVADALNSGAGQAAGQLTGAVEELRHQFGQLVSELSGSLAGAGSKFEQQGRDSAAALSEAAQTAAAALKSGGVDSGEALRTGGSDAGRSIQAAAGELATPSREMGQRIAALQTEALELGRALTSLREASQEATAPLRIAAADLVKLGASGQKTAADLSAAAQRLAPLADAVTGAMTQLAGAEARLGKLSQDLDNALQGFSGLDASLGRVFKDLREGLGGFATQVADFVRQTNQDMAQAVTALSGAVEELRETLEENAPDKSTD